MDEVRVPGLAVPQQSFPMPGTTLALAAVLEAGTGLALIAAPALVVVWLLGTETPAIGAVLGRCFGIALLALALACWPRGSAGAAPRRAMLAYNSLIALYLARLGAVERLGGPLLWPAVALHSVVAILLVWPRRDGRWAAG